MFPRGAKRSKRDKQVVASGFVSWQALVMTADVPTGTAWIAEVPGLGLCVRTPYSPAVRDRMRAMKDRRWDAEHKIWVLPYLSDTHWTRYDVGENLGQLLQLVTSVPLDGEPRTMYKLQLMHADYIKRRREGEERDRKFAEQAAKSTVFNASPPRGIDELLRLVPGSYYGLNRSFCGYCDSHGTSVFDGKNCCMFHHKIEHGAQPLLSDAEIATLEKFFTDRDRPPKRRFFRA